MSSDDETDRDGAGPSMEILALSRGRSVPDHTREAFQFIEDAARADASVVSVDRTTIGLEGETRLCVLFRTRSALSAFEAEIRSLAAGVELLEIRVEDSNCPSDTPGDPERENSND